MLNHIYCGSDQSATFATKCKIDRRNYFYQTNLLEIYRAKLFLQKKLNQQDFLCRQHSDFNFDFPPRNFDLLSQNRTQIYFRIENVFIETMIYLKRSLIFSKIYYL